MNNINKNFQKSGTLTSSSTEQEAYLRTGPGCICSKTATQKHDIWGSQSDVA